MWFAPVCTRMREPCGPGLGADLTPPCQCFSMWTNKQNDLPEAQKEHRVLFAEEDSCVAFLREKRPAIAILENVPGFMKKHKKNGEVRRAEPVAGVPARGAGDLGPY